MQNADAELFTVLALDQNSIVPIGNGSKPLRSMMKGCSVLGGFSVATAGVEWHTKYKVLHWSGA